MAPLDRDTFLEQHLGPTIRLLELEGLDVAAAERRAKEMGLVPGVIAIPEGEVVGWTLEKSCDAYLDVESGYVRRAYRCSS